MASSGSLPSVVFYIPSQHQHLVPVIARIHAECILEDGTLATFLPDKVTGQMDLPLMERHWSTTLEEVASGDRVTALQFAKDEVTGEEELVGFANLVMPFSQTGPFRSVVEKLLVSPRYRRRGIARRLLSALEGISVSRNRGLIMLDTVIGSPAEFVYPRLGWKECGRIPKYGIHPHDGRLVDEVFFYKDLRSDDFLSKRDVR